MNELEEYKKTTHEIIFLSESSKDTLNLIKAYSYLVDYHGKLFEPDSIYYYQFKIEKLYSGLNDHKNVALTLLNKAITQQNNNDYLGAEKSAFQALGWLKQANNNEMLYQTYNLLGIINSELKEYSLSEKYYNNALIITDKQILPAEAQFKATTLNNLGFLYKSMDDNLMAISYFRNAISENNLLRDRPYIYAMILDNLAYSKFKIGEYENLPEMFYKALKIRDSLNIVPGIILNKTHLSEYYAFKKDTTTAFKFAKEANDLAVSNNEKRDQLNTLKQLAQVDPKNALKYSYEYFKINDSLQVAERKARNKFARIEYETEELSIEKGKLIEQRKNLIYIGLGIILIGAFVFVIRVQASKNRELKLVQEQQQANEEIYQLMLNQQNKIEEVRQNEKKRIAQELHDGILGKLFGTRMNLGVLNSKKDDEAITERSSYIDELKTLEQEIREISHDLNSEKTAVFNNFVLMFTNFLEAQRKVCQAVITFNMDANIEWNTVDNMAKINFYRILQEAFQNINKHANAQNVSVTFEKIDNLIQLNIQDDGVGFVYAKKKKGIGLVNMNARITNSGGEMYIETEPAKGTLLQFELPLTPNTNT